MNPERSSSAQPDIRLLERYAAKRDAEAFAELVRRYGGFVFSTARRITGDTQDAEDVTQQCFLELARRSGKVTVPLAGWLHRIACSRSLNARRDKATRRARESATLPPNSQPRDGPTWAELEPLIDEAIAALPDDQRLTLVLHYFHQESQEQVAAELGVNQSTISRRLNEGIDALRARLKEAGVIVTAAGLSTLLVAPPAHAMPQALSVSLTKVGLAGVGKSAAGATLITSGFAKGVVAAALLLGTSVGAVAILKMVLQPSAQFSRQAQPPSASVGMLYDSAGHPISNARISASLQKMRIWYGIRSDSEGRFKLDEDLIGRPECFAYSQRSGKMAVFAVPERLSDIPLPIVLDLNCASADGSVVNAAGAPMAGEHVHIFMTMPNDRSFLLTTSDPTDNSGYYSVPIVPSGPGVKISASLSADPTDANATLPIDTDGRFQIELPSLVDHSGLPPARHPGPKRIRYSGRVVNESGDPIAGVMITMLYERPDHGFSDAGPILTDAQGRFSRLMPPRANHVQFQLLHPDYIGYHFTGNVQPDVASLRNGSAVVVMKKGLSITGIVRGPSGKPMFNALVLAGRSYPTTAGPEGEPFEDCTTDRTDSNGRFHIGGLPRGANSIEVTADGFAPQVTSFDLKAHNSPLQVSLDTGESWSAQVVDASGAPLAGAQLGCQFWQIAPCSQDFSRFTTADRDGRFTLEHLPRKGAVSLDAFHRGFLGMNLTWTPGAKNPRRITLYPPPVITGVVRDADTGRPVTRFDVQQGMFWAPGKPFAPNEYAPALHVNSLNGSFSAKIDSVILNISLPCAFAVRIVADGYAPTISPKVIPGRSNGSLVILLKKASAAKEVVQPSGDQGESTSPPSSD